MYSQFQTRPVMRGPGGIFTMARNVEAWLDDRGKPAWIAAMVLSFIFVWPVGLALLAYMIWRKRMFNRSTYGDSRTTDSRQSESRGGPWANQFGSQWGGKSCGHRYSGFRSSGNSAFDAYKEETLRRLQDEQEAFQSFLQRLREAKDKTEFDNFMDDRARQAKSPEAPTDVTAANPTDGNVN